MALLQTLYYLYIPAESIRVSVPVSSLSSCFLSRKPHPFPSSSLSILTYHNACVVLRVPHEVSHALTMCDRFCYP